MKNAREFKKQTITISKEPTANEKLLKSQNEELDKLRMTQGAVSTSTSSLSLQSQVKSLNVLQKKNIVQEKTIEQQVQELDAIRTFISKQ